IFSKDCVYYKWSHKSLQEYFAAQFIFIDSKEIQSDILIRMAFHENNLSYINVLDLYRSMDPSGFDGVITQNLLTKFLDYLENSYQNFEGEQKLLRQTLTFGYNVYLIRIRFNLKSEGHHPSEVFEILKKHIKIKFPRMSIGINVVKEEDDISCIKVPEIKNPQQNLIEYHKSLDYNFVKEINTKEANEKINLELTEKKPYHVTDRKNSILNKPENFNKVNDLML